MAIEKKYPSGGGRNGAQEITCLETITKIKTGQIKSGWFLRVTIKSLDPEIADRAIFIDKKPARSLLWLCHYKEGLTRSEAMDRHNILCLTQHVDKLKDKYGLDIYTEDVPPDFHARYHLKSAVTIRILSQGGK